MNKAGHYHVKGSKVLVPQKILSLTAKLSEKPQQGRINPSGKHHEMMYDVGITFEVVRKQLLSNERRLEFSCNLSSLKNS